MKIKHHLKTLYHKLKYFINLNPYKEYQYSPINIFKPLPNEAIEKLKIVLKDFEKIENLNVRVSDGTLLGILREKKLIDHDNDIDFDVEWNEEAEKNIKLNAKKYNWKMIRKVFYNHKVQQLTYFDSEEVIFDFIFWMTDERFAISFCEPGFYRVMEAKYLKDLKKFVLNQSVFLIPEDEIGWLKFRYGENWNVPQSTKKDWKDDCGDLGVAWWLR